MSLYPEHRLEVLSAQVDHLMSRAAIDDMFNRYSNALDLNQLYLLESIVADDADLDCACFSGTGKDFKRSLPDLLARHPPRRHLTIRTLLQITGDVAHVDSCLFVMNVGGSQDETVTAHFYGPHTLRLEKREGEWTILSSRRRRSKGNLQPMMSLGDRATDTVSGGNHQTNLGSGSY